jgi:hypothetical protein
LTNDFTTANLLRGLSRYPLTKGDTPGHVFHGNQWTGGRGGGESSSKASPTALTEEQEEKWGQDSQNITGASAKMLGLKGFKFDGSKEDEQIARNYLDQIKESSGGPVLWSGHNLTDEQLSQYKEGATVTLPLTATTSDKSTANTYTVGGTNGAARGGNEVLMKFTAESPRMEYTDIESITAGDFQVKSVEATTDSYWGTKTTVITLSPKK